MNLTLYTYVPTGFLADVISTNSATSGVTVKRGDHLALQVIPHDGSNPTELPPDAAGTLVVKAAKGYAGGVVLQAASWTKQPGRDDGYEFDLAIAGTALDQLLAGGEKVEMIFEISWTTRGVRTTTPTAAFTVMNNLTR